MPMDVVAGGEHWRLATPRGPVHVWRPARGGQEGVVVYVHGYNDTADSTWTNHRLAEQFKASGRDATFVVPGAPSSSGEAVSWPDLNALLLQVEAGTGLVLTRQVTAIGHSGGFETIAKWLGVPALDEVILLDGLYGFVAAFRDWARKPGHRFINVVTGSGTPRTKAVELAAELPGVRVNGVPAELDAIQQAAKTLFIVASQTHMGLVTSGAVIPVLLRSTRAAIGFGTVAVAAVAGVALWRALS